jgi:hypothetical protein
MSEQTTTDFIPINPSGVLDVNGVSVSVEDINEQMLRKLRIDANKQSVDSSEINTVSATFLCLICLFFFLHLG